MNTIDELTLYPTKTKHFMLLLISLAFTAIGIWMGIDGKWMGFLCAAFFGLGILIFIIQLLPGSSYLRLYKDEFEYCAFFS